MPEDPDKTCYIDQGPASAPKSTVDNDVIQNQPDITTYQPPPGSPINSPSVVDDDPTEPPPIGGPDTHPLPEAEHSAGGIHLPANYRLQDYRITEVLGQGGFGITYSAYDLLFDRNVVIKENLPAALSHRDSKTRCVQPLTEGTGPGSYAWALRNFLNEARILSKLEHPNIIKVITAFSALGTAYYVMPYVSGTSLNKASVPMPESEILPMLSDLLDALEYLHSKNLLHRDIKPANILRSQNGTPILIDFGTARVLTEHSQTTVESPGYTPFEQMQSHGNLGPWTDLYALGATMYYLITGTKPLKSADRVGRDDKHIPLAGRPELLNDYSPQLLLSVEDVQRNFLTDSTVHVDFLAVTPETVVRAKVYLKLNGTPVGVATGGQTNQIIYEIPVKCAVKDIPAAIEADITPLALNESLRLSQITLPAGVTTPFNGTVVLASVVKP